jgi:tRNA wybutosine-synthesizing protein 4
MGISFRPSHALDASAGAYPWFSRFGASYGFVQDNLLIIGGIAKGGGIPKTYEILSLTGSFSILHDEGKEFSLRVTSLEPLREPSCPRPFLIGHSTHRTQSGMFVIIGGGATCFHYGNYFNKGIWVLHDKEAGISADWVIVPTRPSILPGSGSEPSINGGDHLPDGFLIKRAMMNSQDDFQTALRRVRPIIIPRLDFGACTRLWTLDYLKEKMLSEQPPQPEGGALQDGPDHTVESEQVKTSLHRYLEGVDVITSDFHPQSLTATTSALPSASLMQNLPTIAPDFQLPTQMNVLENHIHSTLLHLSNGISTFPRHHVTGTVLFQAQGAKKLVLFPPSDLNELAYPAGSTTSNMRVFSNIGPGHKDSLHPPPRTRPHLAMLKAGEALIIPPFWSYAHVPHLERSKSGGQVFNSVNGETNSNGIATRRLSHAGSDMSASSLSSVSESASDSPSYSGLTDDVQDRNETERVSHMDIAISVSFRNLDTSKYVVRTTPASDIGLAAYEDGRRDIDRILGRFTCSRRQSNIGKTNDSNTNRRAEPGMVLDDLPKDVTKALLERLGKELLMKAESL